jgi:hypothetical protein
MKKDRENIIRIFPTESFARTKLSKNFFLSKQNFLEDILKTHWEQFLSTYQYNKKKSFGWFKALLRWKQSIGSARIEQKYPQHILLQNQKDWIKGKFLFSFKKEKSCHFNYLILAQLLDLLGNIQTLHNKVRQLIKIDTKFLDLEKIFQIKVSKNSLFLWWISYLLIEQIYQFLKKTSAFLYKSKLISPLGPLWGKKNKLEIQNNGNFLSIKCQDFLILKWYQNKIQTWSYQVLVPSKEILFNQNYNKISATNHMNNILGQNDKFLCYPKDETKTNYQTLLKKKWFDEKMPMTKIPKKTSLENKLPEVSKGFKQRYLKLIKNILQKSKVTNQVELIQNLNKIIGNWDTFYINNITKKNSLKLNLILYQLLWRWGFARHKKQKAKWIKNRYWSNFKNFLF